MHRRLSRIFAVAALVLVAATAGASSAAARPSGPITNDVPGGGKWIYPTSLPYTDVMDVTQATTSAWDTRHSCDENDANTVWYRYRATSTIDLTLDTFGSSYDTTITVWSATGQYIACNDDAEDNVSGPVDPNNDVASYLNVHLKGGFTYVIRIGSFDDPPVCQTNSSCAGVSDGALAFHATKSD